MSPASRDLSHLESWIGDVRQVWHCLRVQNIGIAGLSSPVILVLLAWAFLPPQACSRFPSEAGAPLAGAGMSMGQASPRGGSRDSTHALVLVPVKRGGKALVRQ